MHRRTPPPKFKKKDITLSKVDGVFWSPFLKKSFSLIGSVPAMVEAMARMMREQVLAKTFPASADTGVSSYAVVVVIIIVGAENQITTCNDERMLYIRNVF